jgi:predicted small secreted protein
MKRILLILSMFLFAIAACNDEKGIEMDIVETGCMNGWDDFYEGTDDYRHAVTAYLENNNIAVYSVQKINYYSGPVCLACSCSTGNLIVIRINENDVGKTEQLGFHLVVNGQNNIPLED